MLGCFAETSLLLLGLREKLRQPHRSFQLEGIATIGVDVVPPKLCAASISAGNQSSPCLIASCSCGVVRL